MAGGPWEAYQPPGPTGPWDAYRGVATLTQPSPEAPHGIVNAVIAGFEASSTGLAVRRGLPERQLPEDSNFLERAAFNVSGLISDIPASVVGYVGGSAVGAPVGAAVGSVIPGAGTGAGAAVGSYVGAGAGAVAAPMAIRSALMTAYSQGGVHSWSDVWEVTKATLVGGGKGAIIGGLTMGAGKVAGVAATKAAPAVQFTAKTSAEVTAMTAAGAALEGRMPTAQDFFDAAFVVGGIHATAKTAAGLRTIYAKTGTPPADVALDAMRDPAIKAELQADPTKVPKAYEAKALDESINAAVPEVLDRATAVRFAENPFAELGQKEGERVRPGYFNYKHIDGPAELHGAIERMTQLYQDKIQTETRGRVAQTQTLAEAAKLRLADTLGVSPDKLPPELNVPASHLDARYTAKRMAAIDIAQELKSRGRELAKLGADITEAQMAEYVALTEKASMVAADALGMRAEVARAQAAGKINLGPEINLEALQRVIAEYGGKDKVMDFARIMADADNPTSVLRGAQAFVKPTVLEYIIEPWKSLGTLSGPSSWLANVFGNLTSTTMKFPERSLAALLGSVRSGDRVTMTEVRALASGMAQGSLDALHLSAQAVKDAFMLRPETAAQRAASGKREQYRNAIPGKLGEAVRIPFKLLTAGDILFRTINERGEAHALAVRQAVKEGFTPRTREFNTRVVDLVQNPDPALAQAIKDAGDQAVFTQKLGKTGTHLQMAVKGTPWELLLPWIKTPANLLKKTAEYIPGVNFMLESVRNDMAGKNGAAARDIAVSRMIIGGTIAMLVADWMEDGTITGGGLAEPEKRRARMAAGWQPYSLRLFGKYYSYQRIEPIGRLLSTAADTAEIVQASGQDDKFGLAGAITSAVGNATISQTYLSGLSNAVKAVTDPDRYGPRWLDQYAASLVPSFVGQTAAAMDPETREVNSILDAMQARIPLWREQLLPKRNPLTGEPIAAPDRLFPFAPITTSELSEDPVLTEAMRLGVSLPIAPRKVQVGKGVGKMGQVEISPEARNAFTEEQGAFAHDILSRIVGTPAWDATPDMIKTSIYSKVLSAARSQAALVALPPEARSVEILRISEELAAELQPE